MHRLSTSWESSMAEKSIDLHLLLYVKNGVPKVALVEGCLHPDRGQSSLRAAPGKGTAEEHAFQGEFIALLTELQVSLRGPAGAALRRRLGI